MEIWHMRNDRDNFARAFAAPENRIQKIILWARGWRRSNHKWWSKGSRRTRILIDGRRK